MSKNSIFLGKVMAFFLALVFSISSFAQVTSSAISGVITDVKGEGLPGATVIALHVPSGSKYGAITNVSGRYTLPAVRVGGPYKLIVTFVGFKDESKEGIITSLGTTSNVDFKMAEEGALLEEVTISATRSDVINSDRTGASTNIKREQFEKLPTLSRSLTDFSTLTPQAGPGFSFGGRSALYNNFSIDGATSNNVFGLSPLPGGQSNSQPISVDAIQELSVSLAPYDVSQGSFTGAGVNAITRSGTNEVQGSVYYFNRNVNLVNKKVGDVSAPLTDFSNKSFGFRIGAPIIKNKLFIFVNAEKESRNDPAVLFAADGTGSDGKPFQQTSAELKKLKDFLIGTGNGKDWSFDPGTYENFDLLTSSNKFLTRIDWNISNNHKFTVRYNQMDSFRDVPPSGSGGPFSSPPGGRSNSNNAVPFSNTYYRINNNLKNVIGELNSSFGQSKFSNNLQIGYSAFRDYRQAAGGTATPNFPLVDIVGPNGNTLTSFGAEPFTPNNRLDQDIIQLNDKFDMYLGKHTISVGTANEFYTFYNVFTQLVKGVYQYGSINDFIGAATAAPTATTFPAPQQYGVQYIAIPGSTGAARWKTSQYGFYAQDKFNVTKKLNLTYGLRVDIPTFNDNGLLQNAVSDTMTFAKGEKIKVGKLPSSTPLWSPRVGFNYDVLGNKKLQLRGGTGVFTGRIPFVWVSNQISNNGLFFGVVQPTGAALTATRFSNVPYAPVLAPFEGKPLSQTFTINSTVPNFKFPQVWRSNIAADYQIGSDYVVTGELIYTKDLNAVYIRDANLAPSVGTLSGDGRPLFGAVSGDAAVAPGNDRRVNDRIVQALVLDNINKGYSTSATIQFQKIRGAVQGSIAYTFTDSKDVNGQSGSTAGSLFTGNGIVNTPNLPNLSYANNLSPHRIVGFVSYNKVLIKNLLSVSGSLVYQGFNNFNFSYVYGGSPNSDGVSTNDLIYIPRNQSEILLTTTDARDTRTTDEIWSQLDKYISQDKYLNSRRGQYAERNGAFAPWVNRLNSRVLIDLFTNVGGKKNTLQLSWETFNLLNLISSKAGLAKSTNRSALLNFSGYETPHTGTSVTTGRPIYTFATNSDNTPLSASYINDQGLSSRWQMQLGIRYIFN
jgi:Carboxypeptidase regulatory-like domain